MTGVPARTMGLPLTPEGKAPNLAWFAANDPQFAAMFMRHASGWESDTLRYQWRFWARENQLAPSDPDWTVWFIHAGRGAGKSRAGAEWVREQMESGRRRHMALVGEDAGDVRDVMIGGESGLLKICPPWARPVYNASKRELRWPNGGVCKIYSAQDPEQLRGPAHDGAWCDELAKWRYEDAWNQLMFGLRSGSRPRVCVTTTLRPKLWIKRILDAETTRRVGGSTHENARFLSATALRELYKTYEGTRLGRQELHGEYLDDTPGALWTRAMFDRPGFRLDAAPAELSRKVVAIDPAVSSQEHSDETGIAVCAKDVREHFHVLADFSGRMTPGQWARKAIVAYDSFQCDCIVAEVNNGGDMVAQVIRTEAEQMYRQNERPTKEIPVRTVHASKGKVARAEPVSMLYEQGRVHHIGDLHTLEDQMVQFLPEGVDFSPDRVDAVVWGITEVMSKSGYQGFIL